MPQANPAPSGAREASPGACPPYSNRGVYPPLSSEGPYPIIPGLDAYNATVYCSPDLLEGQIANLLTDLGLKWTGTPGPKVGYYSRNSLFLDEFGKRWLSVRSGGSNGHPFVECKGYLSPIVAGLLRSSHRHRPSRIDVAEDRICEFDQVEAFTRSLAKKYGLRWEPAGDWVTADGGRTIYLGSRKSQVFLRIYEKGLKYAQEMGLTVTDELRHWVRFELEFKPQKRKAKDLASAITPPQMWGSTTWTNRLAKEVLTMGSEATNIQERRESNRDRALRFMARQYRVHLLGLLQEHEGDCHGAFLQLLDLAGYDGTLEEERAILGLKLGV